VILLIRYLICKHKSYKPEEADEHDMQYKRVIRHGGMTSVHQLVNKQIIQITFKECKILKNKKRRF